MSTNINLYGTYFKLSGNVYRSNDKKIDLIFSLRKKTTPKKPAKYILLKSIDSKERKYVSSVYDDGSGQHIEYNGQRYQLRFNQYSQSLEIKKI